MPALGHHPRAVGKGVFHRVMVEQLVGLGADLPPALPLGGDRPGVLHPAADVEIVDQPVEEEAPVEPGEVASSCGFGGANSLIPGGFRREAHGAVLAVGPAGDHLADGAVVNLAEPPLPAACRGGTSGRRRSSGSSSPPLRPPSTRGERPGASTANDFSMNTCMPFATAYSRWMGRKAGGVARRTTLPGSSESIAFL